MEKGCRRRHIKSYRSKMVKSGVLYVEVDSATWLHHVSTFKKEELLASMQNEFKRGHISEIKFRIGVF
jgi:hypothetical protein